MLTLFTKRFCVGKSLTNTKMFESNFCFGAAIVASCGIGVGWMLRGFLRPKSSSTAATMDDFEVGVMGMGDECKMVLVVRNDLKMGKGKVAAQCCHAAVMAYEQLQKRHPQVLQEWRRHGQPKVVVRTDNEASLLQLAAEARSMGLIVSLVQDAGRTQIAPGSKTVIAVGPGPKDLIDTVTGHLKLL